MRQRSGTAIPTAAVLGLLAGLATTDPTMAQSTTSESTPKATDAIANVAQIGDQGTVRDVIMSYYASRATELGGRCSGVRMIQIMNAPTLKADNEQAQVSVTYAFDTASPAAEGLSCKGMSTRVFTLVPGTDGTWAVVDMTGVG